jgi:hypothetical protein
MDKRLKRNIRGSNYSDALHGELSRNEERMVVRSWEMFWDPSRARDILRDAGVFDRLEEQAVRNLLVKALAKSRDVIGEAKRYPIPFLYVAWTLVQPIEAPALVTSFAVVDAVKCWGRCEIYLYRSNRLLRRTDCVYLSRSGMGLTFGINVERLRNGVVNQCPLYTLVPAPSTSSSEAPTCN